MSTTPTNDGGPAFPASTPTGWAIGMSLRDYFAAHANEKDIETHLLRWDKVQQLHMPRTREEARFAFADAMIAARNQTTK